MAKQKKVSMTLTVDANIFNQVFQVLTGLADLLHQDSKIAIEEVACDEQNDLSSEDINSCSIIEISRADAYGEGSSRAAGAP